MSNAIILDTANILANIPEAIAIMATPTVTTRRIHRRQAATFTAKAAAMSSAPNIGA